MEARPHLKADKNNGLLTFLDYFEKHAAERPDDTYLGTRRKIYDPQDSTKVTGCGEYEWQTYSQIQKIVQNLGRGMTKLGLANVSEGDDKKWKFVGIWSKNRWEWLATHIANMYFNHTSIGFFDSMGV
jgi:long-subunit acyl-CoA synthetase (AMP-forming)